MDDQGSNPGYIDAPESHDPSNDRISRDANVDSAEASLESEEDKDQQTSRLDNMDSETIAASPSLEADEGMLEWNEFPPMRAVYCRAKKKYVAKFDHFCAILNTAIGERNHCLFWWFILAQCCVVSHTLTIAKTGFDWFASNHSDTDVSAFVVVLTLDIILFLLGKWH